MNHNSKCIHYIFTRHNVLYEVHGHGQNLIIFLTFVILLSQKLNQALILRQLKDITNFVFKLLHTMLAKKRDTWLEGSQQSHFMAGFVCCMFSLLSNYYHYLCVWLSICLTLSVSLYVSVCLDRCQSVFVVCQSLYLSVCQSWCLSVSLSI